MQTQAITATTTDINNLHKAFMFSFLFAIAIAMMTSMLYAQPTPTDTVMGDVLCSVVGIVYGNLGRGLASLAVVALGVGALVGKVSWGMAITVAVGIAVIFNADDIVGALGVTGSSC